MNRTDLRDIVTDSLVAMVTGVTGMVPPKGEAIPDFIQGPIDRAVDRIFAAAANPTEPEEDQLTDLATWKHRAIEAESKLRTYDPQVVELGEQAMQALLANPKPSELVLTKCRLCDQLQADLTARDQQIDALRQGMKGDYDLDAWLAFVEEAPQLRLDAERYRWLRDKAHTADWEFIGGQTPDAGEAEIDAAMAKEVQT